jgi:hypothetical protein
MILGKPFVAIILGQDAVVLNFRRDFPLVEFEPPSSFVFQSQISFEKTSSVFNKDKLLRSERLLLDKIQRSSSKHFLEDAPILKNKVILKLKLSGINVRDPAIYSSLGKDKNLIVDAVFSTPLFLALANAFNECNIVLPSLSNSKPVDATVFYLHLQACSHDAVVSFNQLNSVLKAQSGQVPYKGTSLEILECFSVKLNIPVFLPPQTVCYKICFKSALVERNVVFLEQLLTACLGPPAHPRVVLGHVSPETAPSGPIFFVSFRLLEREVQRALVEVYSHLRAEDLVDPLQSSCVQYNPQIKNFCITCGLRGHRYKECPSTSRGVPSAASSPSVLPPPAAASSKPCHDFQRGNCIRDQCRFSHDRQPARSILQRPAAAPSLPVSRLSAVASASPAQQRVSIVAVPLPQQPVSLPAPSNAPALPILNLQPLPLMPSPSLSSHFPPATAEDDHSSTDPRSESDSDMDLSPSNVSIYGATGGRGGRRSGGRRGGGRARVDKPSNPLTGTHNHM